jgi:hypothetical protein
MSSETSTSDDETGYNFYARNKRTGSENLSNYLFSREKEGCVLVARDPYEQSN